MHGVYKERIPDEVIPRLAAAGIPEVATLTVFDSYADLYEGRREATAVGHCGRRTGDERVHRQPEADDEGRAAEISHLL